MQNSKFRIILNVPPPPFLSHKKSDLSYPPKSL